MHAPSPVGAALHDLCRKTGSHLPTTHLREFAMSVSDLQQMHYLRRVRSESTSW